MEIITVKSTATNSEILKLVQSLTIDKVDFDSLPYKEAGYVTYAINSSFREIAQNVGEVKRRVDSNYPDIERMLELGLYDFTINLNFAGSRLEFGQYQIKIVK